MKICLILSFCVIFIQAVSSKRRFCQQPRGHYRSNRRSRDALYPATYDSVYPQYVQYPALPSYDATERRAGHESPYPSFQYFEDTYPAYSPYMQTLEGHPYHSQRIRIKHSFPAHKNIIAPSPQLNQYLPEFGDTPDLNRLLPGFGGMALSRHTRKFGKLGGLQMSKQLPNYNHAMLMPLYDTALSRMNKIMAYDTMDPRMMQYAKNPNTVVVEKKIPVPYKVEKPYFVEVTKHVAVPVAVPVVKPMPYPVNKYIEVPKFVQVPQHENGNTERSTTLAPHYTTVTASSNPQFEYPYYTSNHEPHVSIHPNGASLSPDALKLERLEKEAQQGGALTLKELQALMNSEKLPDDPFIIKK